MLTDALPILYSFRRCPYAMRARLAVSSAGIAVELREVVLRSKPRALLQASPKGTVPVLVLPGGRVIDESLDIMQWALGCGDPDGWLAPRGVPPQDMHRLIAQNDGEFKNHLDRYKYPQRFGLAGGATHRDAAMQWLAHLDCSLRKRDFLFGDKAVLADMAILPFVRQYAYVDLEWFRQQPWPGLHRWLDWFLASRIFAGCMEKYTAWQPGGDRVVFPAS